ncbi:uncharacterized protein LOC134269121 [Saccostrea cucullata]|uniref:uncharacterized protein LOC134269121 n=1 Tax=Saccostrea cuccullata TaxID=36930 RepID=UPI002ED6ADEA
MYYLIGKRTMPKTVYNIVLNLLKQKGVGFTSVQVGSTGVYITKTLTNVLWYLDPHIEKFNAKCIHFGDDINKFRGYNDWRHQKKKEPKVTSSDLHEKISELLTMMGHPFFLSKESKKLLDICNTLVSGMKKYLDFLSEQKERTAFNHQKPEPVRGLNDKWSLRKPDTSQGVNKNYLKLHESLLEREPFDPLFLYDILPEDKFDRRKWIVNLTLPYSVKLYTHRFGNYLGNFHFVWKIEDNDANGDLEAISSIKENLPVYATRAMRNEFINRYSKTGTKPAILRDMYRFLTRDASAAASSDERAVDDRVLEFLLQADAPEMFYDLRKNNGRPKDTSLDLFWNALDSYLEEKSVVQERRQSDKMYMPLAISCQDLIEIIAARLPAGSNLPSRSWLSLNFWPSNAFVRSAVCYTGRFKVKNAVQQRLTRATHPDSSYAFNFFSMLKELAVNLGTDCALICLDDKSIVPIGELGSPTSTGVRAHNKSLIPEGAKLSALDHDFHIHGAVPSVLLDVELPKCKDDSFYNGVLHVTVKDKVFTPSSPIRHAAESISIFRNSRSSDGLFLDCPILFIYTDGGPDHRTTFWSVKLAHIATFIALDLDLLIAARTAPFHSYYNPAERCMSLLNLALQNVSLQRNSMDVNFEYIVKPASSLKKLRDLSERQPNVKTALEESLEPTLSLLKHRFSKLKLHNRNVVVHDAATFEEIKNLSDVLDLFKDTEDSCSVIECNEKNAPKKLKDFIDKHCRARQYSFQIKKCTAQCWYCTLNPKRLPGDNPLHWLPDPTKGPDGTYQSLEDLMDTETTDKDCPGLSLKGTTTDNDKKESSQLHHLLPLWEAESGVLEGTAQ